ncbi:MAG: hypothetical protein LBU81_06365 [Methanosarcinales archaeon]|jgi:hypothetical protein|nr:hypothetical protein [Methanosarcinales archaeon]
MIPSLYIFFGILAVVFFFLGVYDFSFTKSKISRLPLILSFVLSAFMGVFSFSLESIEAWESSALAGFWIILIALSLLLFISISFSDFARGVDRG